MVEKVPSKQMKSASKRSQAVKALKWSYIGSTGRSLLQLIAQVSLARLSGPNDFGVYVGMLLAVAVIYILGEAGASSSLVHVDESDEVRRSRLMAGVMVRATIALFLALGGISLWNYFNPIQYSRYCALILMAFGVFAQIASSFSLGLYRSRLNLKRIQINQGIAQLVGFLLVGLPVAIIVNPLIGLASYWCGLQIVNLVLGAYDNRRLLKLYWTKRFNTERCDWDRSFGIRVVITNILNWAIEGIDTMLVGKLFGASAMGIYSNAYSLMRQPTNLIVNAAQAVVMPIAKQYESENELLRTVYTRAIAIIFMLMLPAFAVISIASNEVVLLVYGQQWIGASSILSILAFAMPLHAVSALSGPLLWASREVGREMKVQAVLFPMLILGVLMASVVSVEAVSLVVVVIYGIRAIMISREVHRSRGWSFSSVGILALYCLILTTLCYILAWQILDSSTAYINRYMACILAICIFLTAYVLSVISICRIQKIKSRCADMQDVLNMIQQFVILRKKTRS